MPRKSAAPSVWQNRIVGHGEEAPDQLLAHPLNFRTHPKQQQQALSGAITDLGWLVPVIVNRATGHVLDGHLRVELAISRGEPTVPVTYVDLPEELEAEALLTIDPIAAMAQADKANLDALLRQVETGDAALQRMLADLAGEPALSQARTAARFVQRFEVVAECADEQTQQELYERLSAEGYSCRVLSM